MNKWINIKDKLPEHYEAVLAFNNKGGFCVCIFIDGAKMNEELIKNGHGHECVDIQKRPYYFCSQEIKGHTLNNVTYWQYLVPPKENYNG